MHFKVLRNLLILSQILFFSITLVAKDDFPERPSPPRLVNDFAHILSASENTELEQKLNNYNDTTSTQIAIVTMQSIGDYEAADYAQRLGEKWGIGQKGKSNGILILVSMEKHDFFIATGYGMEGVVPDAMAKRIFEEIIKPTFREQRYYEGLNEATDVIIKLASGEYKAEPKKREGQNKSMTFFILIILFLIVYSIIRRNKGGGGGRSTTYSSRGPFIGPPGGGWGGGWGSGGSSGGGFGGFGGGDFGGGGSGGKW